MEPSVSGTTFQGTASGNVFKTSLHTAPIFFGVIIGKQGTTIKRIQNDSNTTITLPRGETDGYIEIFGKSEEDVNMARQQIESIVSSARDKYAVNHFTNVRITNDEIKCNYERFMQEILRDLTVEGLTEQMFIPAIKLHITINVMTLLDAEESVHATQLLSDCVEKVILPVRNRFDKIAINVCGVNTFKDERKNSVKVLFAKIQSDPLQQISNEIMEYFIAKGVSKREKGRTSVRMHMTLINTKYDTNNETNNNGDSGRRYRKTKAFDATSILEKYANYNFGSQDVNEILLSSMKAKDNDGFYKTIASVKF